MSKYWDLVSEDAEFAQGDVLRRISGGLHCPAEFGVVVTADCDIVQQKAGNMYTYLEVVPAANYIDLVWAPEQNRKFVKKQAKPAAEQITAVMKRSGLEIGITEDVLVQWLMECPLDQIERVTNRTSRPFDAKLISKLRALQTAVGGDGSRQGIDRWQKVRREAGDDEEDMRGAIRSVFDGEKGFPDYFMLPELPGASGYGFVAMLRSIRTVASSELFRSEVDARIAGHPDGLHRVGRLADGVRFAITQKLAFLFSRIGLPKHFEDECRSATDLLAESLIGEH